MNKTLALVIAGSCAAQPVATLAADDPHPVGLAFARYDDPQRRNWDDTGPRPLASVIWYPAAPGAQEKPWTVGIFNAGRNAPDAALAPAPARLPLVVLSHGTGGGAPGLAWLAEALASRGYIVAGVNHHGNTGAEPSYRLEGFIAWWERPRDLGVLIDRLLADPRFGQRIDPHRIGVAGFSLGGYSALASVGARLSRPQWDSFCAASPKDPSCLLPPEIAGKHSMDDVRRLLDDDVRMKKEAARMGDDYRDPRIRAALSIAPVLGPALVKSSLEGIGVPVRIVVGDADDQAVPGTTARPVATAIKGAELSVLPRVTHYAFLATCTGFGRTVAKQICVDPDGVDRAALHAQVADDAVAFFNRVLRRKPVD